MGTFIVGNIARYFLTVQVDSLKDHQQIGLRDVDVIFILRCDI